MQRTALYWKQAAVAALALMLCFIVACPPPSVKPPIVPSVIMTDARVQYNVSGLKLPGTRQEIRTRRGDGNLWIPLQEIATLRFTGIVQPDEFRRARIVLTTGEILEVEVQTSVLIEGNTEAGYWNMPLSQVAWIEFGN